DGRLFLSPKHGSTPDLHPNANGCKQPCQVPPTIVQTIVFAVSRIKTVNAVCICKRHKNMRAFKVLETTTTIAVRVSREMKQQIQDIANANGETVSDWGRVQFDRGLDEANPSEKPLSPQQPEPINPSNFLEMIDAKFRKLENDFQRSIASLHEVIDGLA